MYKNEEILNYADKEEVTLTTEDGEITLTKMELGNLYLATGQIVANDPYICFETTPFIITEKPGYYPVSISITHYKHTGSEDKRVALALLKLSDKKPVRWEMALTSENTAEELEKLGKDEFFGYGVDSGTGGFMDKTVAEKLAAGAGANVYDKIAKEFNASYVPTYSYLLCSAIGGEHKDFACFSSGWGDGCYPSYFGFDEEGNPCALVTDFCILPYEG